jgi:dihydrofolate reductase
MKKIIVAAMARDRTIAKDGKIPWRYPEDQKFFKQVTMGYPLIMGRKTFESIGRILPGRDNIIVTRGPAAISAAHPGAFAVSSLDEAFVLAEGRKAQIAWIAGGGEIYATAMSIADAMIITYIPEDGGGDVLFPEISSEWREVSREQKERVLVVWYDRRTS